MLPSLLCGGYRVLFTASKAAELEFIHSPTSNTYVKNGGTIPSLPHTSSWPGV
jgi:hypothetical protein